MLPKSNVGASIGAGLMIVLVYALTQFSIELGAGHVPIPEAWRWLIPILGATITGVLTAITPYVSKTEAQTGYRTVSPPPGGSDAPVVNKPS